MHGQLYGASSCSPESSTGVNLLTAGFLYRAGAETTLSGKKKMNPNPNFFGPHIFGWGEGVGAKKFGMSFETQENQTFWRDIPGFCLGYPGGARKVGEKKVSVQFSSPTLNNFREKFRVSPTIILNIFSAVDTQTAVLVSTAEVWIPAPDT